MRRAAALALALGALLAWPAAANLPEDSCFVLEPPGTPDTAVVALTLRVAALTRRDRDTGSPYRYADLIAVLGPQGQGLADGVHGKPLTQNLVCRSDTMTCQAAERRARALLLSVGNERLILTTDDLPVADYGDSDLVSNLAHPVGSQVAFRLRRVPIDACPRP